MKKATIAIFATALILFSCATKSPSVPDDESSTANGNDIVALEDESDVRETKNVIYQGVVKPAGISIYQQGSHRLLLEDGRFILLESDNVDLNGYVGEHVEIVGSIRPTVEEGGMIMRVESAKLIIEESPSSAEATEGREDDLDESDDEEVVDIFEDLAPDEDDEVEDEEEPTPEEIAEEITEEVNAPDEPPVTEELSKRIQKMANERFEADQWTQEYCTAHIGFCVPVHRNWWFKSFGTTTSFLWHVELSSEEVGDLYSGPVHVNLVSGSIASKKVTDGQIRKIGPKVIGYRKWSDSRHFEISAPNVLKPAVEFITANLKANE